MSDEHAAAEARLTRQLILGIGACLLLVGGALAFWVTEYACALGAAGALLLVGGLLTRTR